MARPEYTAADMSVVIEKACAELNRRTKEKGAHCLASRHEIMGMVMEEYRELEMALEEPSLCYMKRELADLVVAGLLGLISIERKSLDW